MIPIRVSCEMREHIQAQADADRRSLAKQALVLVELGLEAYERRQKVLREADRDR